jgi:hypothetical protein
VCRSLIKKTKFLITSIGGSVWSLRWREVGNAKAGGWGRRQQGVRERGGGSIPSYGEEAKAGKASAIGRAVEGALGVVRREQAERRGRAVDYIMVGREGKQVSDDERRMEVRYARDGGWG